MPRQETKTHINVELNREVVNRDTFDVLRMDGTEIVAFHVTNIDKLVLEHSPEHMVKIITQYLIKE